VPPVLASTAKEGGNVWASTNTVYLALILLILGHGAQRMD
jgi:hypothetical protein